MSKGDGQKIAIKFDKGINALQMSYSTYKYFRWQIDSGWSSRVYLYGIELKTDGDYFLPVGAVTASGQYSSYSPDRAFDGSTSTYWRPNTIPAWVQIELSEPILLTGFRWNTQSSSYRPKGFSLLASNDGANWIGLYSGESPSTTYWKEFAWAPLLTSGNEPAFTITGMVRNPLEVGELQPKTFQVQSVDRYGEELDTILLTFDTYNRFNDVEGDITVAYNQSLGTLAGTRPVESFTADFTPADLEPTPVDEHTVTAGIDLTVDLITLDFTDTYTKHTATAGVDLTVALIDIDDINP